MLYIVKSASTLVALSLAEKTTISATTPHYLFKLTSQDTNNSVYFTAPDISTNPQRYNLFNIIETGSTSQNLTAGTIYCAVPGYYTYEVWQQTSATNLVISGVTGTAVEIGKAYVRGPEQIVSTGANRSFSANTTQRYVFS